MSYTTVPAEIKAWAELEAGGDNAPEIQRAREAYARGYVTAHPEDPFAQTIAEILVRDRNYPWHLPSEKRKAIGFIEPDEFAYATMELALLNPDDLEMLLPGTSWEELQYLRAELEAMKPPSQWKDPDQL
jgi:hypothetical protein